MAEWIGDGYDNTGTFRDRMMAWRTVPAHIRSEYARQIRVGGIETIRTIVCDRLIDGPDPWQLEETELIPLFRLVTGTGNIREEIEDERNLRTGLRLYAFYPHLARFTCQMCRTWWLDPTTGEVAMRDGKHLRRQGPLLCEGGVSLCPVGHFSRPKRLSDKNQRAVRHYQECVATGQFPDDPLVRHHARIIRWALEKAKADRCRMKSTN